jgi:hypothetical protein
MGYIQTLICLADPNPPNSRKMPLNNSRIRTRLFFLVDDSSEYKDS